MTKIHAIAHTHWDFEWYFTRQEARVQFAFHMDDVFSALANNQLDYYLLDGQMSIVDDYLETFPEKKIVMKKYVKAHRLFIGPWYTQIDEMVTSGEAIVHNLRAGMKLGDALGGAMKVGYLPDSFGQGQDMPKIYRGMEIKNAVFWRGFPTDKKARYFYWDSNDGSQVLVANIKNGYYAGVDLIENDNPQSLLKKITTQTNTHTHVLPVGGDQRPVDFDLKQHLHQANQKLGNNEEIIESNYPQFFHELAKTRDLPTFSGEFIDPSDSKIHRGIYSSRYDLKQLYDHLERQMTYQIEPLMAMAEHQGIQNKQGLIDKIWKVIARGQAHDSAGGCNSDQTNRDIHQRAVVAQQLSDSLKDYLLRKLSLSVKSKQAINLFVWNPLPIAIDETREFTVSTKTPCFQLFDLSGQKLDFDLITQKRENAATLRRDLKEMDNEYYYISKIALPTQIDATDWTGYRLEETNQATMSPVTTAQQIDNAFYTIKLNQGQLNLHVKAKQQDYPNFLTLEDSGDEGDTYDYSPAFNDWVLNLDFQHAEQTVIEQGKNISRLQLRGQWQLPANLKERKQQKKTGVVNYQLTLKLHADSPAIGVKLNLDNHVLDHRMRLVFHTDVSAQASFADTPFGTIERPVEDPHLHDWQKIGYHEEPTSMRPMLHFANTHNDNSSWTFLSNGMKDFQLIGTQFKQLAVTLFRGVGYLGRPDLKRRPSDASGLQTKMVPTPDSQLTGKLTFSGALLVTADFNPNQLQKQHLLFNQTRLYYQNQAINRFTTPIQYFMLNPLTKPIIHSPLVNIENLQVTLSLFANTIDHAGFELRLYNASNHTIQHPGILQLTDQYHLAALNLRGQVEQSLADTNHYTLPAFKPGEIRTYGLYPLKTKPNSKN